MTTDSTRAREQTMTEPTDAERDQFEEMMRLETFDDLARLSDGTYKSYEARVGWIAWQAARRTPAPVGVDPFGIWHEGETEDESDFYLFKDSGDVACPSCIKLYSAPQPTQPQAGAVPLTDIRKAALDLYTPPFRHEYGYIRDANHQMVADDASSEATGLIAARIRGWGRIQYMDKPEMRANALQDEVAEMVAEALNAYWAANGIKGGQHG